jgi:type 1 fimbria pilin
VFLSPTIQAYAPVAIAPGGYTVELRYDTTTASCAVTPDGKPTVTTGQITFAALPVDHLAIAIEAISVHVEWAIVYRP